MFRLFFSFIVCGLVALTATNITASPIITVAGLGNVTGLKKPFPEGQVDAFLGIPYAKPPVGSLRFRPPVPYGNWSDGLEAVHLPPACFQKVDTAYAKKYVDLWNPNTNLSEDCLYLNVWKPSTQPTNPRTVMVWIYGGGFVSGSSSLKLYDGSMLALKGDVVVVSMQYRVGPLGFLTVDDSSAPGNVGLLDQQLALRWVHDHIAAFGGDPSKVTLFGESAGSASVSYHLLSPGSASYFRYAIMQSAAATAPWASISRKKALKNGLRIAEKLKCPSATPLEAITCLRNKGAAELTETQWDLEVEGPKFVSAFIPTVDGKFVKKAPAELVNSSEFQRKNILVGTTSDEGAYFLFYLFPEFFGVKHKDDVHVKEDDYKKMIGELNIPALRSKAVVEAVAFEYAHPCRSEKDRENLTYAGALDNLIGDREFKCPVRDFALAYTRQNAKSPNNSAVYFYEFDHTSSGNPWPTLAGGAMHGYEIDVVFGRPFYSEYIANYTSDERKLSETIIGYWTNFAKTGDPNLGGTQKLPNWPKFGAERSELLLLSTKLPLKTKTGIRDRECDYWAKIVPRLAGDGASVFCSMRLTVLSFIASFIGRRYFTSTI